MPDLPNKTEGGTAGAPPEDDAPEPFRPEGAEIESAGGIVAVPPAPEAPEDPPTEGDRR